MIVDGYNVINTEPRYRVWKDRDLELARIKLVEDMATLGCFEEFEVIVVFDAAGTKETQRRHADVLGVGVWFSRGGETADQVIEELVYRYSREREVVVATSDYAEQRAVFRSGVRRRSARELVRDMEESVQEMNEAKEPKARFRLEERVDAKVREALRSLLAGD